MSVFEVDISGESEESVLIRVRLVDPAIGLDGVDVWSVELEDQIEYFEAPEDYEMLDVIHSAVNALRYF
jgi:hypothetical protein